MVSLPNHAAAPSTSLRAGSVGGDQQPPGGGVALLAHGSPPSADRADGEACGVVIGADADPTDIVGDVVDPVRHGAAQPGIDEVVNLDRFGPAGGTPGPAIVLEIAHQFLLLRIDRDDRLARCQERLGLGVDIAKLRVAIDVVAAFPGLAVGLQAIAHAAQQAADDRRANPVPFLCQLLREGTQAAGCPQQ